MYESGYSHPHRSISRIINPSGTNTKETEQVVAASSVPPGVQCSPDACRSGDQIHGRNGRPAGPGCLTPSLSPCPSSPPEQGFFLSDRSQGTGPREFLAPVICPPHAQPEKINSCFPRFCQYRIARAVPWFMGIARQGVGDQAGIRTASHGCPHAQFQTGSNWVRCLLITDWPSGLTK